MAKQIRVSIAGTRPLLMHATHLMLRGNPLTQEFARLKTIRKKTEADEDRIQRVDWEASMYFDAEIGPYIPVDNLESMIREGARLSKGGKNVERGVAVMEDRTKLEYDGPRSLDRMYNDGVSRFVDARTAKNPGQRARIMRCRPRFDVGWHCSFTVSFDTTVVRNAETLKGFIDDAGRLCGLGDWRPKFGRFQIVEFAEIA